MSDAEYKHRFVAANEEAKRLGYEIKVGFLPNRRTPLYRAVARALHGSGLGLEEHRASRPCK